MPKTDHRASAQARASDAGLGGDRYGGHGFSAAIYDTLHVEVRNWKDGAPADVLAGVFA